MDSGAQPLPRGVAGHQGRSGSRRIGGTAYAKGRGVHAASAGTYYLGGTCTSLSTDVGIDAETATRCSVVFQILADHADWATPSSPAPE